MEKTGRYEFCSTLPPFDWSRELAGEDEDDQQGPGASKTGGLTKDFNALTFSPEPALPIDRTLRGLKLSAYALIKILKFCTGSSAKSYQCKFAISEVLSGA